MNRRPFTFSLLTLLLWGCANSDVALLPVDLDAPGWEIWTGQVSWRRSADTDPIAGELLVAKGMDDQVVVTLSKAALPLFTAGAGSSGWRIDFVERDGRYSGRGRPPDRFVWFRLPALFADPDLAVRGWSIDWASADEVLLAHRKSGERVRVILDAS